MNTFLLPAQSADEVEPAGGRIIARLGGNLIVAELPGAAGPAVVTERDIERLDPETALLAAGWYESERLAEIRADEPPVPWDEPDHDVRDAGPGLTADYRSDFNGQVAVAVYLVSGPGDLAVSDSDRARTTAQIIHATTRAARLNPLGRLNFTMETPQVVQISAKPRKCDSKPDCESVWEGDVLRALHVTDTDELIAQVAERNNTDRAYIAFFVKYPTEHYAYHRWGVVYMEFKNGHRGPENIWKVFIHESMHVFHALDEYKQAERACSEQSGFFDAANCNSLTCGGKKLTCVMNENAPVVCTWSRRQAGWDGASPQLNITDVNEARTTAAPALVEDPARKLLCMFFRGEDAGVLHVCTRASTPKAVWSAQRKVLPGGKEARTGAAPAAAMHKGRCFVAYTGISGDGNLYVTSLAGSTWSSAVLVTTGISAGPALVSHHGELVLIARRKSGDLVRLTSRDDGSTWSGSKRILDAQTSAQPAAAVYAGTLFVAFRGRGDDGNLYVTFRNDDMWAGPLSLTDINAARTKHGPALAVLGDDLLVFWQGDSDAAQIWVSTITMKSPSRIALVGSQLSVTEQNGAQCGHGLGVTAFGTGVQLGYRGADSHNLWTCHYAANAPAATEFAHLWQTC
ncbi:MAG: sialidase family protein [Kibdelosporangium sp.]